MATPHRTQQGPPESAVLKDKLVDETVRLCGHEERKGQLSMSWLHLPIETIVDQVRNGHHQDDCTKLKLYQGTHAEKGMRERLNLVCQVNNWSWGPPEVLTAYEGRLTGHTDGSINGCLMEIKTVPDVEALAQIKATGKVPFKVFSQMNAYLLWGKFDETAFAIYETRKEGEIWVLRVTANPRVQDELQQKAEQVLAIIDEGK